VFGVRQEFLKMDFCVQGALLDFRPFVMNLRRVNATNPDVDRLQQGRVCSGDFARECVAIDALDEPDFYGISGIRREGIFQWE